MSGEGIVQGREGDHVGGGESSRREFRRGGGISWQSEGERKRSKDKSLGRRGFVLARERGRMWLSGGDELVVKIQEWVGGVDEGVEVSCTNWEGIQGWQAAGRGERRDGAGDGSRNGEREFGEGGRC